MSGIEALTEEEKVKIRHHLGYLNVSELSTFALGSPAGVETQYMIEAAWNKILPYAFPQARKLLCTLEEIECQMVGGLENLAVTSLGEINMNPKHQANLKTAYLYWRSALANLIGVYPNPFDKRFAGGGGGTMVPIRR